MKIGGVVSPRSDGVCGGGSGSGRGACLSRDGEGGGCGIFWGMSWSVCARCGSGGGVRRSCP